jgi:hypothetical protein
MTLRFTKILMLFLVWGFTQTALAQDSTNPSWDAQKIKGVRMMPYPSYTGFPFLTSEWCPGKVVFTNGEISDTLFVRYSSYKDELIYYNATAGAQISIDKASINGFEFIDAGGRTRSFRKQYFDDYMKGDRYFEILSSGETTLLAFRKVGLNTTPAYHDISGVLKNMVYDPAYQFYFYSPEKGYTLVRISQSGFLSKFDKTSQKPIKKLLRKSRIKVSGEDSFIQAWKAVEKEGYKVVF